MQDHVFLSVSNLDRAVACYSRALAPWGIVERLDYDGTPDPRQHYDPSYYAANIIDPDGYSLEFVYKSWQH